MKKGEKLRLGPRRQTGAYLYKNAPCPRSPYSLRYFGLQAPEPHALRGIAKASCLGAGASSTGRRIWGILSNPPIA